MREAKEGFQRGSYDRDSIRSNDTVRNFVQIRVIVSALIVATIPAYIAIFYLAW